MSAPMDVLEVLRRAFVLANDTGWPTLAADLKDVRAAVAELIEAAKAVEHSYVFEVSDASDVMVEVDHAALLRMCAVLAHIGGAK